MRCTSCKGPPNQPPLFFSRESESSPPAASRGSSAPRNSPPTLVPPPFDSRATIAGVVGDRRAWAIGRAGGWLIPTTCTRRHPLAAFHSAPPTSGITGIGCSVALSFRLGACSHGSLFTLRTTWGRRRARDCRRTHTHTHIITDGEPGDYNIHWTSNARD